MVCWCPTTTVSPLVKPACPRDHIDSLALCVPRVLLSTGRRELIVFVFDALALATRTACAACAAVALDHLCGIGAQAAAALRRCPRRCAAAAFFCHPRQLLSTAARPSYRPPSLPSLHRPHHGAAAPYTCWEALGTCLRAKEATKVYPLRKQRCDPRRARHFGPGPDGQDGRMTDRGPDRSVSSRAGHE